MAYAQMDPRLGHILLERPVHRDEHPLRDSSRTTSHSGHGGHQTLPPDQRIRRLSRRQRSLKVRVLRRDSRPLRRHECRSGGNSILIEDVESGRYNALFPLR